MKYEEQKVFAL